MILGIDSSLPLLSVALIDAGRTMAAAAVRGEASRNEKLLPMVDWLLRESGATLADVHLLAVTRGPGSFTGLRIGLATVQGIGRAARLPVCAMSTLHAAAFDGEPGRVVVTSDAGRSELYAGIFSGLEELQAPAVVSAQDAERLSSSGDRVVALGTAGEGINVAVRAARFAAAAEEAGRLSEWGDAVPLYVRLAEPEVKLSRSVE